MIIIPSTPPGSGLVYDDFNRADSGTLGSNWVQHAADLDIVNNEAIGTADGTEGWSTWVDPMNGDDVEVEIILGSIGASWPYVWVFVGSDSTGERVSAMFYYLGARVQIQRHPDWTQADAQYWGVSGLAAPAQGDTFTLRRHGPTYAALINGVVVVTATDTSSGIPIDEDHRLVGIGSLGTAGCETGIDVFSARDLTDGLEAPYYDDFDRPDNSFHIGEFWNIPPETASIELVSNQVVATDTNWGLATWGYPMGGDDFKVEVTVGDMTTTDPRVLLLLGGNGAGEVATVQYRGYDEELEYGDIAEWGENPSVAHTHQLAAPLVEGDKFGVHRIGDVYYVYINDAQVDTWDDGGSGVPRDADHRLVGIGLYKSASMTAFIDDFAADDL